MNEAERKRLKLVILKQVGRLVVADIATKILALAGISTERARTKPSSTEHD